MADANNTDVVTGATPVGAVDAAPTTKKTRKPRAPKAAVTETPVAEAPVKKTRAKRGSKAQAATDTKSDARKLRSKSPRTLEAVKTAQTIAEPLDDIASLLKLEEENKVLRKQLFDKLHAENADLRKRLGQS